MKNYLAECLASFCLVFCGTGAVIVNEVSGGVITGFGIAVCFGFIVMVMIFAFGNISGAHMNPAVTIGFALQKTFPANRVLPYIISQVLGATIASFILSFVFPSSHYLGATIPSGSVWKSLVLELILSFILMLTILNVAERAKEKGLIAGIAIGAVVLVEALFAGPISGASMNPARSLAPALVSGKVKDVWIYILAPISGAAVAVYLNRLFK